MTRVLVIGGGMGGLTTALALLQQGVDVEVHEQAGALREVGAGLTLGSSALKGLHSLGLFDAVRRVSQPCGPMPFVHYRTARLLWGRFATGTFTPESDAPFAPRHVFRADLQTVLARHLALRRPGALHLARELTGFAQDADGVTARFADGAVARGDVLIGADGIHSIVREASWGASRPDHTGQVAWRFVVDGATARPYLGTGPATVFFGPDRVLNRYLLRHGTLLNCVAIVRTPHWHGEGWTTPGDPAELAALFDDWHPDVRGLMALARDVPLAKWALATRPALSVWIAGRVALLGDAAHPMLPFLGMGAATAIEDAVVLGRAFGATDDPVAALARYQAARRPRSIEVADASVRQGEALQSQSPDAFRGEDAPVADPRLFDYDPSTVPV